MSSHPEPALIRTVAELEEVVGRPVPTARDKVRHRLTELDRAWLAASPFCVLATSDAAGRCDASPKGDPAGSLVHVLDDTRVVIAERPGNRRVDGYRNVLENPHVGLLFLVPGRGDTLRVNGRARLVRDADWFDRLRVRDHRPVLALEVTVEEVFSHCSKAFLRSQLWQPESWHPDALPSRAAIAKALERPETDLAELERYYGPSYAERLY
ncbi:pyridoxamine 5'-phosphate oxidase family protein [Auraticoccus sp. F435]|uniref:Pyridoxamine 5'-phosphate oxidase family protein n=1 Tax=Auraticoccus cholistanensis TaxID=2656650 RepID=A0A6A9UX14_9ACTN|nr:pyridoxamine 5'-phosphate oxidase family protein [Auraticoccus cholistanensis]MVA76054.1 pyridoxamine 5'-phosphate oxidase family protein [Auraticoccus cholistanensis]